MVQCGITKTTATTDIVIQPISVSLGLKCMFGRNMFNIGISIFCSIFDNSHYKLCKMCNQCPSNKWSQGFEQIINSIFHIFKKFVQINDL